MRTPLRVGLLAAALALPAPASALPSLAIDLDPGTPGIETSAELAQGSPITVAITISGVDLAAPLNAFELDLDIDPLILAATAVVVGSFLAAPADVAEEDLTGSDVNVLYFTLGPAASSGAGVLALVTLLGQNLGTSALSLSDVILSAPFGVEIPAGALGAASIRVVPEPASALLALGGLVGLAFAGRGRRAG